MKQNRWKLIDVSAEMGVSVAEALFGCGQAVGLFESLNSLPQGPVYTGSFKTVLQYFYSSCAWILLFSL